jgi:hypothetical protein
VSSAELCTAGAHLGWNDRLGRHDESARVKEELRSTAHLFSTSRSRLPLEPPSVLAAASGGRTDFTPHPAELQAVIDTERGGGSTARPSPPLKAAKDE